MIAEDVYGKSLGTQPTYIVTPSTAAHVAQAVAQAAERGEAVIPWGGGTGQAYGYVPRRADVLLDLSPMNRILAVEPGDLTVTVEAGATLDAVQDALAPYGQFLPLDPPDSDRATIGGILATNAWGPSRPFYGTARDWLIGLTVVDAQGRTIRGGGKVVKNVTGYDLPKLHVGALGTLGVIVEATFKVAPRPETTRVALFDLAPHDDADGGDAASTFLAALHHHTAPTQRLLREQGGARVLALLFSGMREVVDSEHAVAGRLAATHGIPSLATVPRGMDRPFAPTTTRDDGTPGDDLILRVGGLPDGELARHAALARRFGSLVRCIDTFPGSGQTEVTLIAPPGSDLAAIAQDAVAWAESASAPLAFWQAPLALRQPDAGIALWSPLPPAFPLMRRLKESLDGAGTLNPQRFIGRL